MLPSQFDAFTRAFADRRMTRRSALAAAGGSLAGAGFARTSAQDEATPIASPVVIGADDGTAFLFVQTFGAGSLVPAAGEGNDLILTADHLAGQTLYFSDRPERIVGMVPTAELLGTGGDGLGFTPVNPPNGALVLPDDRILVVELIDPTYDPATGQVTYQLRVLEDVADADLSLETVPLSAAEAAGDFDAASLFIDDCADGTIMCVTSSGGVFPDQNQSVGYCYNWGRACCAPCTAIDANALAQICNNDYQDTMQRKLHRVSRGELALFLRAALLPSTGDRIIQPETGERWTSSGGRPGTIQRHTRPIGQMRRRRHRFCW